MLGAMLSARGHKHVLSIGDSQGHGLLMSPMAQHQRGDCLEHPSSMLPPQRSPPSKAIPAVPLPSCGSPKSGVEGTCHMSVTHRCFHRHCHVLQTTLHTLNLL